MQGADLVLFCVKSTDTEAVAEAMAPHLGADALVLSLQNGVENAATIARRVRQPVVPAVVYVATAMPEPGVVKHYGRGDLVIGAMRAADSARRRAVAARLQGLVDLFATAKVPVRISRRRDGRAVVEADGELRLQRHLRTRPDAVRPDGGAAFDPRAAAGGRRRGGGGGRGRRRRRCRCERSLEAMEGIAAAMPAQLSSTAQDMARGKPSEIDHLNGFVARRGRELGIATPTNQALHALVKLVESGRHG